MTPDESLWQRLEADFARVLGEIPKPEGPDVEDEGTKTALLCGFVRTVGNFWATTAAVRRRLPSRRARLASIPVPRSVSTAAWQE